MTGQKAMPLEGHPDSVRRIGRFSIFAALCGALAFLGWLATHKPQEVIDTLSEWQAFVGRLGSRTWGEGARAPETTSAEAKPPAAAAAPIAESRPACEAWRRKLRASIEKGIVEHAAINIQLQQYARAENPRALAQCIDWAAGDPEAMAWPIYGWADAQASTDQITIVSRAIGNCAQKVTAQGSCVCSLIHQDGQPVAIALPESWARTACK